MTPADLRTIGRLLYGNRWQTPMARALGVHPRTVVRWERGDAAMRGCVLPEDLPERLRQAARLMVDRAQHALNLAGKLRQAG